MMYKQDYNQHMEAVDLGVLQTGVIKQTQTTLEMAQDLQTGIMANKAETASVLGYEAISMMGDPETLNGLRRLYVHVVGSFVVAEALSNDSVELENAVGAGKYGGELYMRGNFARFAFVEFQSMKSICLRMMNPEMINADISETDINVKKLKNSCMYVPVHAVESVLAA